MKTSFQSGHQTTSFAKQRMKGVLLGTVVALVVMAVAVLSRRNDNSVEYHRAAMLKARKDASWVANRTSNPTDVIRWWLKGRPPQWKFSIAEQEHYEALTDLGYFTEREFALRNTPLRSDRIDVAIAARTNFADRLWYLGPSTSVRGVRVIAPLADMEEWRSFLASYDSANER